MFRLIFSAAAIFAVAAPLAAQDKPTPEAQKAVAGTWKLDASRSDSIGNPLAALGGGAGFGGGSRGGGGGGGGGGGRGGGRRGGGAPVNPDSSATPQAAPDPVAGRGRDPNLMMVVNEMSPGAGIVIAVNDSAIAMANAAGVQSAYKTDGKRRQAAQMDGTVIETLALWKDNVLQVTKGIAGVASVKREFKPSKDGATLEVKETLDVGGRKVDKKLVFTRQ